jgi:hypothetical protein
VTRLVAAATIVAAFTSAVETRQSTAPARQKSDGLLRSELSLGGYTAAVSYSPGLAAADPAHRGLLSGVRAAAARVKVATLETNGALRIGSIALGGQERTTTRHDLWLKAADGSWALEATPAGTSEAAIGETILTRQSAPESPAFSAALVPELGNSARLLIRWAGFAATADVVLTAPPRATRVTENRGANVTVNRSHTEDTSALSRVRLLAQRNETMIRLPSGDELSASFQRSFAANERTAGGGTPRTRGLSADGPDFARLQSVRPGDVVMLTEAAVPRLRIERPLRFGRTEIAVGNQVPGFPGSYGLWLKRSANTWRLVFNHEPDAWGSQHDDKFDAAEIDLQHSDNHAASRPFAVALVPTAADRGCLTIIWGPHEWTADFVVLGPS